MFYLLINVQEYSFNYGILYWEDDYEYAMALISRIFGSKKKSQAKKPEIRGFNPWKSVTLADTRLTVLVFRECHLRGRRLLFDSSSVVKTTATTTATTAPVVTTAGNTKTTTTATAQPLIEVENGVGFVYKRQRADAKTLAEIVFGSVPLAFTGATNKLHMLGAPGHRQQGPAEEGGASQADPFSEESRLKYSSVLLSRVFVAPKSPSTGHGSRSTACSLVSKSLSPFRLELSPSQCTCPVDCPVSNRVGGSGCGHTGSVSLRPPSASVTPFGTPVSQYDGSSTSHSSYRGMVHTLPLLHNRWRQSSADCFTNMTPDGTSSGNSIDSPLANQSFSSGAARTLGGRGGSRKAVRSGSTRLAVAVLLAPPTIDDKNCDHGPSATELLELLYRQLQLTLCRLQLATEMAYIDKKRFVRTVFDAAKQATQDLVRLLSARRLSCPVWLGLTTAACSSSNAISTSPLPSSSLSSPTQSTPPPILPLADALTSLFVTEFVQLVKEMDTKQMSFFVSTLLTAVLTHHVGWVSSSTASVGDLSYRGARVLVIGSRQSLVDRVLFVLSYFVRQRLVDQEDQQQTAGKFLQPVLSASSPSTFFTQSQSPFTSLRSQLQPLRSQRSSDSHGEGTPAPSTDQQLGHAGVTRSSQCEEVEVTVALRPQRRRLTAAVPRSPAVIAGHPRQRHVSECQFQLTDNDMDGEFDSVLLETSVGDTGKRDDLDDCFIGNIANRQTSDSIRDSFHYLRGYYSYRYLQASQSRRVRHYSEISAPANSRDCSNRPLSFGEQPCASMSEESQLASEFWCTSSMAESASKHSASGWSEFSTATDHYISGVAVSGIVGSSVEWRGRLLYDAKAASLDGDECLWIIANTDDGSVCVLNSCDVWSADTATFGSTRTVDSACNYLSDSACRQTGLPTVLVVLSPLVAALVESSCQLHECGVSYSLVSAHLEQQLSLLTHHAAELSQLLANSPQLNLSVLLQTIGIDSNDVPLLLAVATVLFPHMGVLTAR